MAKVVNTKTKLKEHFEKNSNSPITVSVLAKVAYGNRDWTRLIRFLRAEGMNIVYTRKSKANGLAEDTYAYISK